MKRFKILKPESDFTNKVIVRTIVEDTVTYSFEDTDSTDVYNKVSKYTNEYKYFEFPESNINGYITVTSNIGIVYIYSNDDQYIYIYDILLGSDGVEFNSIDTMDISNVDESIIYKYKSINPSEVHQLVCYADKGTNKTIDDLVVYPLYTKMIVETKSGEAQYGFIDMYAESDSDVSLFTNAYNNSELTMQNNRFDVFEFDFKTYYTINNVDYVELDSSNPESMKLISLGNNKYYISYDNVDETVKTVKFNFYASSDKLIEVL